MAASSTTLERTATGELTRFRRFLFTLNNPADKGVSHDDVLALFTGASYVKRAVFQLEKGESGTPHFQGYVEFLVRRSFMQVKAFLPAGSNLRSANGTAGQNYVYCTKEKDAKGVRLEGPWETGDWSVLDTAGKRTDLLTAAEAIKGGISLTGFAEEFGTVYMRYTRGVEAMFQRFQGGDRPAPTVFLFYGKTGKGKSRLADRLKRHGGLSRVPSGEWFSGSMDDQENLLFDEFFGGGSGTTLALFNMICDRYPVEVPIKGGHRFIRAKRIIFTSNSHPLDWYKGVLDRHPQSWPAFVRRFDHVVHFDDGGYYLVRKELFFPAEFRSDVPGGIPNPDGQSTDDDLSWGSSGIFATPPRFLPPWDCVPERLPDKFSSTKKHVKSVLRKARKESIDDGPLWCSSDDSDSEPTESDGNVLDPVMIMTDTDIEDPEGASSASRVCVACTPVRPVYVCARAAVCKS